MNPHLSELLGAIGPGICYVLGALALFGLRQLFKSFENVLARNAEAHNQILLRLNEHENRIIRLEVGGGHPPCHCPETGRPVH